jgi:hypothetical protein
MGNLVHRVVSFDRKSIYKYLIEFQTSASTVVTKVQPDGTIYTRGKELVPVIYAASQPTGSEYAAGTIWVDSTSSAALQNNQDILSSDAGILYLMGAII